MSLTLLSTEIRTYHGLYLLNDLHKASGGLDCHLPNRFTRSKKTKELIEAIGMTPEMATPLITVPREGVYASKELVIAYAMWISAKFNLAVIRAFDGMMSQSLAPQTFAEALQLAADQAKQLEIKDVQLLEQSDHIDKMAPIVDAAIQISASEGSLSLTLASKSLSLGRKEMIQMMLDNRWLYRNRRKTLVAYELKLRSGYLDHNIYIDNKERTHSQVVVKPKGLLALSKMAAQLEWANKARWALSHHADDDTVTALIEEAPKSVMKSRIYSDLVTTTLPMM